MVPLRSVVALAAVASGVSALVQAAGCTPFGGAAADGGVEGAPAEAGPGETDGGAVPTEVTQPPSCDGGAAFRLPLGAEPSPADYRLEASPNGDFAFSGTDVVARVDTQAADAGHAYFERIFDVNPTAKVRFEVEGEVRGPVQDHYSEPFLQVALLGSADFPRTVLTFFTDASYPNELQFEPFLSTSADDVQEDQAAKRESRVLSDLFSGTVGVSLDLATLTGTIQMGRAAHEFSTSVGAPVTRIRVRFGIPYVDGRSVPPPPAFELKLRAFQAEMCP